VNPVAIRAGTPAIRNSRALVGDPARQEPERRHRDRHRRRGRRPRAPVQARRSQKADQCQPGGAERGQRAPRLGWLEQRHPVQRAEAGERGERRPAGGRQRERGLGHPATTVIFGHTSRDTRQRLAGSADKSKSSYALKQ
jgi:hypothetical protein